MELILHIGMGKTGSSALQKSLSSNGSALNESGAQYLGMWMEPLHAGSNPPKDREFIDQPLSVWEGRAEALRSFGERRSQEAGLTKFIVSNESFFHCGPRLRPFIEKVREFATVKAVVYVRNPLKWLPSAYLQWGVRHKTRPGPIPAFSDYARANVRQYEDVLWWQEHMGDILVVRPYDRVDGVVRDFLEVAGIGAKMPEERFYATGEAAENVLRALFNERFPTEVLPQRFNNVVGERFTRGVPRLEDVVSRSLDFSSAYEIVETNRGLWDRFRDATGVDLLADAAPPPPPDTGAIRDRLVDHLLELALDQSLRLKSLERRIADLEGAGPGN